MRYWKCGTESDGPEKCGVDNAGLKMLDVENAGAGIQIMSSTSTHA